MLPRSSSFSFLSIAVVLYSVAGTCKRLGMAPFVDLRQVLPCLFALGKKP